MILRGFVFMSTVRDSFIASKMLVDGEVATVEPLILDYRSLLHHYENAVLLYRTQSIIDIERDFEEIF